MRQKITDGQQYILVRKRVEKISKFYKHLATYVIVNIFLSAVFIVGDINDGDAFEKALFNFGNYKIWLFWGIGLVIQALNTFGLNLFLSKGWEEKKIQQYMNEQNKKTL